MSALSGGTENDEGFEKSEEEDEAPAEVDEDFNYRVYYQPDEIKITK